MSRIVIVLTENYADWESAFIAAAARQYYGCAVLTASPGGRPVTSAGGFRVSPDMAIAEIDPGTTDILVLNGGTAWAEATPDGLIATVRGLRAAGKPVAAICGAVAALAGAGLLDAVAHTGNSLKELTDRTGYGGQERFVAQPAAVVGDGFITAPATAPVSFMKAISEALGFGGPELDYYASLYAAEHGPRAKLAAA